MTAAPPRLRRPRRRARLAAAARSLAARRPLRRQPAATAIVDAGAYRAVAGHFATGVTVVTVGRGTSADGVTVSAFSSVSLDPLLVSICLGRASVCLDRIRSVGAFAVNVLEERQGELALHFANPLRRVAASCLDGVAWTPGAATGTPLLDGALAWIEACVVHRIEAGDHELVIGAVEGVRLGSGRPLLHYAGALRRGGGLTPLGKREARAGKRLAEVG